MRKQEPKQAAQNTSGTRREQPHRKVNGNGARNLKRMIWEAHRAYESARAEVRRADEEAEKGGGTPFPILKCTYEQAIADHHFRQAEHNLRRVHGNLKGTGLDEEAVRSRCLRVKSVNP